MHISLSDFGSEKNAPQAAVRSDLHETTWYSIRLVMRAFRKGPLGRTYYSRRVRKKKRFLRSWNAKSFLLLQRETLKTTNYFCALFSLLLCVFDNHLWNFLTVQMCNISWSAKLGTKSIVVNGNGVII